MTRRLVTVFCAASVLTWLIAQSAAPRDRATADAAVAREESIPGKAPAQANRLMPAGSRAIAGGRPSRMEFSSGVDAVGNAVFSMRDGHLHLQKSVSSSGHVSITLSYGQDAVHIEVNAPWITVTRGRQSATLNPLTVIDQDLNAARTVLGDSEAVRSFRLTIADLENETEVSGIAEISTLLDGALVTMLDGDIAAPERIARLLTRRARARLRRAQLRPVQLRDCVSEYEAYLLDSWSTLERCLAESNDSEETFVRAYRRIACEGEWLLRSQTGVWQFVRCSAFPTR